MTLVTGDRVRLREYAGSRTTATLLPGSPSSGDPAQLVSSPGHTYVIPKLSVEARKRLDYSMFDVATLAERSGPVAVRVRFDRDVKPRDVVGLHVDESSARTVGSASVVDATYTPGEAVDPAAWTGVNSVRLASTQQPTRSPDYEMRTLTIKAKGPGGGDARFVDAYVQNARNTRLFLYPVAVVNGVGKVSVPKGDYSVVGLGFSRSDSWLNIAPEVKVVDDTTVTLRAKQADVHPRVSVAGARTVERSLNLVRTSQQHGSLALGLTGFVPRLQPVPAKLAHGGLRAYLDSTLRSRKSWRHEIYTKDMWAGIPKRISVHHRRKAFARTQQKFHALGGGAVWSGVYGFAPGETSAWVSEYRVKTPSRRRIWLQARKNVRWLQSASVEGKGRFASVSHIRRYQRGRVAAENFQRSPIGPGLERGNDSAATGRYCSFCRDGKELRGSLPLWNSAGTAQFGSFWLRSMGSWSLHHGKQTLAKGAGAIAPKVTLPAKRRKYRLSATARPGFAPRALSGRVSTSWGFSSAKSKRVVRLLMPSYVPPADLRGRVRAGKVSYRLNFDNLGPRESRVKRATVRYSTSGGKKWRKARVQRIDKNSFRVRYRNPSAVGKRRYVSLQVKGKDAGGRTVKETAVRAYRLRAANRSETSSAAAPGFTARSGSSAATTTAISDGSASPRDRRRAEHARPACAKPDHRAYRCYALIERSGREALTRAGDPAGWGATELRAAYGLPKDPKPGQKVGVVVAGDYPTAAADMNKYRRQYGLALCKIKDGCFKKINQRGKAGAYPRPDPGWAMEAALDLQMISAACPTCKIVLAESDNPTVASMGKAVDAAVDAGAVVTNHSYGLYEYKGVKKANRKYARSGVTAVSASGDYGFEPASFPASSNNVLAVGGTTLHHAATKRGWREKVWKYGGSACSAYFSGPSGQDDPACQMRTVADAAAVSDGLAVYNSFSGGKKRRWWVIGGTSASSPFIAGMIAAAKAGGLKPRDLYASGGDGFNDVRKGRNGFCKRSYLCTAKRGYDGPTGFGTPRGLATFRTP
ncbi:S8 family serine peptidase [Nocardioidaceae bacterium SCSIO 66511]|nr:S8 family serine peptidase [Nocardioidaceae bacterium SCSIO 66511]